MGNVGSSLSYCGKYNCSYNKRQTSMRGRENDAGVDEFYILPYFEPSAMATTGTLTANANGSSATQRPLSRKRSTNTSKRRFWNSSRKNSSSDRKRDPSFRCLTDLYHEMLQERKKSSNDHCHSDLRHPTTAVQSIRESCRKPTDFNNLKPLESTFTAMESDKIYEDDEASEQTKINNNPDSYFLSSSSQADMEEWMKAIKRVILSPFGGGIFGQKLEETLRYDQRLLSDGNVSKSYPSTPRCVPIIVENCVEFIRNSKGIIEEGLFRLPGQSNEVKDLQDAYDMGERPVFPKATDVHTVASLLKGYIRELPEPVIPFDHYDEYIAAAKLSQTDNGLPQSKLDVELTKEKEEARSRMKGQIKLLPQANFDLLRYLCQFLHEVQQHSSSNKMDASNLALVFGPNIMKAKEESAIAMMADTSHVQHVMFHFITSHEHFFPIDERPLPSATRKLSVTGDEVHLNGDAGIGTLTTTGSRPSSIRHPADDSGTGSLDATPENTHKRAPPVPACPPPARKPLKPNRRRQSSTQSSTYENNELLPTNEDNQRLSYYDNVTSSSTCKDIETFSNLSVSVVVGSVDGLEAPPNLLQRSSPITTTARPNSRSRGNSADSHHSNSSVQRSITQNATEELHTYRITPPRKISSEVVSRTEQLSVESASDESLVSSPPVVPAKPRRRARKADGNRSSSQCSSKTDLEPPVADAPRVSPTMFDRRFGSSTSVSGKPPTYKELEEQVKSLKEDLQKQRQEHEKRSKMLEEHYIMKMRTFIPPGSLASLAENNNDAHVSFNDFKASLSSARLSLDSLEDGVDASESGNYAASRRRASTESQLEMKYRDEVKRHFMTKIRLRNAERGLKQAEERNQQLQREMEQFFDTFGSNGGMLDQAAA